MNKPCQQQNNSVDTKCASSLVQKTSYMHSSMQKTDLQRLIQNTVELQLSETLKQNLILLMLVKCGFLLFSIIKKISLQRHLQQ